MRWRVKAAVQAGLSALPANQRFNYLFQRWVTRNLPPADHGVAGRTESALRHLDALRRFGARPPGQMRTLEIGAGWHLYGPLVMWAHGVERQTVVDIKRMVRRELVDHVLDQLRRLGDEGAARLPAGPLPAGVPVERAVREAYGIEYRAPCDARATGMEAGGFDCVLSTFTFEHIPADDIAAILRESHRLLRPGGIMTHLIDYQDHYSYFDRSITRYNFLRFTDAEWRRFNPDLHYQNRLRHRDYLEMFRRAGFEVVDEDLHEAEPEHMEELARVPLAARWAGLEPEEVAVRSARVVLRRAGAGSDG